MSQTINETTRLTRLHQFIYDGTERIPGNATYVIVHESVTRVHKNVFYEHRRRIEIVKLPEGLKRIGNGTFAGCIRLREINFPALLETMGLGSFSDCRSLVFVDLSKCDSLESIDGFIGCVSLQEVKLPPSVKIIFNHAFCECTSLTTINFPPKLETIAKAAFVHCTSLTSLDFPDSLNLIENIAFSYCTSLMYANFPEKLQRIGRCAFEECVSLISMNLPEKLIIVGGGTAGGIIADNDNVFLDCYTLELRLREYIERDNFDVVEDRNIATLRWLERRFENLPIHDICSKTSILLDQLNTSISHDTQHLLQNTDELGMTSLHVLCLNPKATPEMLRLLSNAYPPASTMQVPMVTNAQYNNRLEVSNETREMMTPIKLWLKMKSFPYNENINFNDQGVMKLVTALGMGMNWNDLISMMSIQASESDCGLMSEVTQFYPFMQAATMDEMSLETIYHLALYDPNMCSVSNQLPRRKRARHL